MRELYRAIKEQAAAERERAREIYGEKGNPLADCFHSDHESYAVILEEFDEADRERRMFALDLEAFWMHCKNDHNDEHPKDKREILATLSERAVRAACEWVQTAAAVDKATATLLNRIDEEE